MIRGSKWDKTLEFLTLSHMSHPLMTVRALECQEWSQTEQFQSILNGTYKNEETETLAEITALDSDAEIDEVNKKAKPKFELPKFMKKTKEDSSKEDIPVEESSPSVPDEIRKYKELMDEGILTEEEFTAKKKQLLGI